jgi:hypothetical protein
MVDYSLWKVWEMETWVGFSGSEWNLSMNAQVYDNV